MFGKAKEIEQVDKEAELVRLFQSITGIAIDPARLRGTKVNIVLDLNTKSKSVSTLLTGSIYAQLITIRVRRIWKLKVTTRVDLWVKLDKELNGSSEYFLHINQKGIFFSSTLEDLGVRAKVEFDQTGVEDPDLNSIVVPYSTTTSHTMFSRSSKVESHIIPIKKDKALN